MFGNPRPHPLLADIAAVQRRADSRRNRPLTRDEGRSVVNALYGSERPARPDPVVNALANIAENYPVRPPQSNALIGAYRAGSGDVIPDALRGLFGAMGFGAPMRERMVRDAEYIPILGDLITAGRGAGQVGGGNYLSGAGNLSLAALGLIPGLGDAAAGGVRGVAARYGNDAAGAVGRAVDIPAPHARAQRFRDALADRGVRVGEVRTSTNRDGGHSAYVSSPFGELRFSDHSANMDFRPGQMDVYYDADRADDFLREMQESRQRQIAARQAERAALAQREAPFRSRFQAARDDNERYRIIVEAYPWAAENAAARRDIRRRWLSE